MWRVRRPAGGPVTGTGSLRGSSFRLPCKRTTASSRLTSSPPPSPQHPSTALSFSFSPFPFYSVPLLSPSFSFFFSFLTVCRPSAHLLLDPTRCAPSHLRLSRLLSFIRPTSRSTASLSLSSYISISSRLSHERVATRAKRLTAFFVLRFFATSLYNADADALLSLAPFCHSRSTAFISSSLFLFLTS